MVSKYKYTIASTDTLLNNDKVIGGSPFLLSGYSYTFKIKPKCNFWRLGIRLSENEDIDFFHPENRYKLPNFDKYIDLHIGVGNWNNIEWSSPNQIELKQYNIDETTGKIDYKIEDYEPQSDVIWKISREYQSTFINTSLWAKDQLIIERKFSIPIDFEYFKLFAWADGINFELEVELDVEDNSELELEYPTAVKFGNFSIYNANIEDIIDKKHNNLIILPIYENGEPIPVSKNLITKYKVDFLPEDSKIIYDSNTLLGKQKIHFLGFKIPLSGNITNRIFKNICIELKSKVKISPNDPLLQIAIPIIDLNSRGLNSIDFLRIMDEVFNETIKNYQFNFIATDKTDYENILNGLIGKYTDTTDLQYSSSILQIEKIIRKKLLRSEVGLDDNGNINKIQLRKVNNISFLAHLVQYLKYLILSECNNLEYNTLKIFKVLNSLEIEYAYLTDLTFLTDLPKLNSLVVKSTGLVDITGIESQIFLENLDLSYNKIQSLEKLRTLKKLKKVSLIRTEISEINSLFELTRLETLEVSFNKIESIHGIKTLKKIQTLIINNNNISDFTELINLQELNTLIIHGNPWEEVNQIKLTPYINHLTTVNNFLQKQNEENKKPFIAPVKVLLLGNHRSGKSSLVDYLTKGRIRKTINSTHIIRLENYNKRNKGIPKAVLFDFGGQDYYHGIYRAFLTGKALYLMLWSPKNNKNFKELDSNNYQNQNYDIKYWMAQRTYLVNQKFGDKRECPTFLIQSYIDVFEKKSPELKNYDTLQIKNEFAISLHPDALKSTLYKSGLLYIKNSIDYEIDRFSVKEDQPEWYINFIDFILSQISKNDHEAVSISEIRKHYGRTGMKIESYLKDDLSILHDQGLVLYYPDISNNYVWLNPAALVTYIHSKILTKKLIKNGQIKKSIIEKNDKRIIQFLIKQKVIFKHSINGEETYIVPNFLPLVSESKSDYDLMAFGLDEISFVLKFYEFMPFGLINQLIVQFGTNGDLIKYWRDQVLFTFEKKSKVLIHLDMDNLEIKVKIQHNKTVDLQRQKQISAYLFYAILSCYWDFEIFEYEDFLKYRLGDFTNRKFKMDDKIRVLYENAEALYTQEVCRPDDLYISLDDTNFIRYCDLAADTDKNIVSVSRLDENRKLTTTVEPILVYNFQPFLNKDIFRPRKCVISYSKQDYKHLLDFKRHLYPIYKDGKIEAPWNCTELYAGITWDDEIQKRFNEADIIFYLISGNLLTTPYVLENEIKKGIERYTSDPKSVRLVPIVISYYDWINPNDPYNLGKFTGLPYTLRPVDTFENKDMIWYTISKSIKRMIEKDYDPINQKTALEKEIENIYLEIINSHKNT